MILASYFAFRVHRSFATRSNRFYALTGSKRFHYMEIALAIATVLIFVRCCFRVAELKQGFNGHIANSEPLFMVFEGPLIFIAVGLLTAFHPGMVFKGLWAEANFGVFKKKGAAHKGAGAPQAVNAPQWTELENRSGSAEAMQVKAHR